MSATPGRARDVFVAAVKLDPDRRDAYLAEACGGDDALRGRVRELLAAHDAAGNFLVCPALGATAPFVGDAEAALPGATVGPYKLLELIGEGGFGIVYLAEQSTPVRRRVALKILKAGKVSRQHVARFEVDRQALALMDHPNIVRVFDGGTTPSGHPYFAMELVKGVPITEFCDRDRLPPRQRLELFLQVCAAVQHAHQKGIIHRDLTPGNVLVARHDTTPTVKVIDFGIAKAVGQDLTDKTLFTGFAQMIGTPLYMSPEQAGMSALDIDTRSDVYSLGVLLYELLTGTTPLAGERLRNAGYDEIRRLIREEEPPRPSTRLSELKDTLTTVSAQRRTEPARLRRLLRGELDWVVMKCLEKDRARRYETVAGLAADVRRYLADEPVMACPPSALYRVRKFVRRHRGPVVAAAMLAVALVVGMVGTTWGLVRATQAEADLREEGRQKEAALAAARKSERDRSYQLFRALVTQARANTLGKQPGRRFDTLDTVREAVCMARDLELPEAEYDELRNVAVAALSLTDMRFTGPQFPWPADAMRADFDESFTVYARTDRRGNCSVRRVADDSELHFFPGLGGVGHPRFSRDGRYLSVWQGAPPGSTTLATHVWDLGVQPPRRILAEKDSRHLQFQPDGRQVVLSYVDGSIAVFDLPCGRLLHRHDPDELLKREVFCVPHPTDPVVAVGSYFASVIQLRETHSQRVLSSISLGTGQNVASAAWSPDGRVLALGEAEGQRVRLFDLATLREFRTFPTRMAVTGITYNYAGDRIAVTGWGEAMELYDVHTGERLFTATIQGALPRFSRDDRFISCTARDGKLGVWEVADGREYRSFARKTSPPTSIFVQYPSISPDGRLVAAALNTGFVVCDVESGAELAYVSAPGMLQVLFEPSGSLLTTSRAGTLRWPFRKEPGAGEWVIGPPRTLPMPPASTIAQSRDGRVTVCASRRVGTEETYAGAWVWHADRPDGPIRLDAGQDVVWAAVDPGGRWVATSLHAMGKVRVWDARDGRLVKTLCEWWGGHPQFSADGRWLYTDLDGGRMFAVGTWEPGPLVGKTAVSSPGGRYLAMKSPTPGAGDGRATTTPDGVYLSDADTGRTLAVLVRPDSVSYCPAFTPDDSRLVGLHISETVCGMHVWDLRRLRDRLNELGLDWKGREFSPPAASAPGVPNVVVNTDGLAEFQEWVKWSVLAVEQTKARDWRGAVEAYTRVLAAKPDNVHGYAGRGTAHAELGEWNEAAADFEAASRVAPHEHYHAYYLGLTRLHLGDPDAYRKVCAEMIGRLVDSEDASADRWVAWACVLAPDATTDWAPVVGAAERYLAADQTDPGRLQILGGVLYRAGRYKEAAACLSKADAARTDLPAQTSSNVYTRLLLAMAMYRAGDRGEAARVLALAAREIDGDRSKQPVGWNRRVTLRLLRREAEALVARPDEVAPPPRAR